MPSRRVQKAAEAIREVVSMAILVDLKDPRIQGVTVTFVEVTADMRQAKTDTWNYISSVIPQLPQGVDWTVEQMSPSIFPIVVVAIRSRATGWRPASDAAVLAVRAWDVLTAHPTLLGAPTHAVAGRHPSRRFARRNWGSADPTFRGSPRRQRL